MPHQNLMAYVGMAKEMCRSGPVIIWSLQLTIGEFDQPRPTCCVNRSVESSRSLYEEPITEDRMVTPRDPRLDGRNERISRLGCGSGTDELPSHHVDLRRWPGGCLRYPASGRRISLAHHVDRRLPL